MTPTPAVTGVEAGYYTIGVLAPELTTGGPQRSEYSHGADPGLDPARTIQRAHRISEHHNPADDPCSLRLSLHQSADRDGHATSLRSEPEPARQEPVTHTSVRRAFLVRFRLHSVGLSLE